MAQSSEVRRERTARPRSWHAASLVLLLGMGLLLTLQFTEAQAPPPPVPAAKRTTWKDYGGGADSSQYSALNQINRSNVSQLKVAWTFPTGDGGYLFNPIVVDGVMYVFARSNNIVALDAATGKEIWAYQVPTGGVTSRGMNYWESRDRSERRLLFSSGQFLQAIDAKTGQAIPTFGADGKVDLKVGLERDPAAVRAQSNTPGRVFEDLIILGSATNQAYASAPGDIRAFNVRTGALAWTFHTVPRPGEFGYETWPADAYKTVGGANAWGELTVDEGRAMVFVPTGSPKYNFYGGNRKGANLFGDTLLALNARTGKRIWHFQMVHHDIWDYDNTTAPKLLTIRRNGQLVDVVAQAGKTGWLYVFNRDTGAPIWPIEERPVPKSNVPGEQAYPTQPFPTVLPPFARQAMKEKDLRTDIDPAERERFLADMRSARDEGMFTPPELDRYTMETPGNNGGSNFGGAAVDPVNGTMFIISKDWPSLLKLTAPAGTPANPPNPENVQYQSAFGFLVTQDGTIAITPPWTTFTAYDLNTGTIKWQQPLGGVPEFVAKGMPNTGAHFPKIGPVVTAGGLVFTGARDKQVRAMDVDTGKTLWQAEMDAGVEGIPAVYEVNGKQYIVYCAASGTTTRDHAPFYADLAAPAAGTRGAGAGAVAALPAGDAEAPAAQAGRAAAAGGARGGGRGGRGGAPIRGAYVAFALPDGAGR